MSPSSRRDFLQFLGLGAAATAFPGLSACFDDAKRRRPNIVLILTDDHRHDMLGVMQNGWLRTPELDRLADDGVRFTDAFVTTSLCSPSRATFLTGMPSHEHRVVANEANDPVPHARSFAEILQKGGYETAFVGKWHMARWSTPRRGFDHWVSFNGQGDYERNTLNVDGEWVLSERYVTDELTDRALDFIDRDRSEPFLLILSHKAVHAPCDPAPRHETLYDETAIPALDGADSALAREREEYLRAYAETLAAVDESLGRVRAKLRALGIEQDTALIYTGDNGFFMGEHGGLWDKRAAYEESMRIPLLMSYPGVVAEGEICNDMVLNLDLAPTVLALAGIAPPPTMQGRSWMPQLGGAAGREEFLYEYFEEKGDVPTTFALRTTDWKLIVALHAETPTAELYDLRSDPGEQENLVDNEAHHAIREQLFTRMLRLSEESGLRESGLPHPQRRPW